MKYMQRLLILSLLPAALGLAPDSAAAGQTGKGNALLARGQYVAQESGCNDCHTEGYLMSEGKVPVNQWLKGSSFGRNGPWGTTYASNLRLFMQNLTEAQWLETAHSLRRRPPMPWFNLNKMHDDDLRALYHFVRSLGDPGKLAPSYLPPGVQPPAPFATFPAPPPAT
jgi:mono/diheme cytochrome c family protein